MNSSYCVGSECDTQMIKYTMCENRIVNLGRCVKTIANLAMCDIFRRVSRV